MGTTRNNHPVNANNKDALSARNSVQPNILSKIKLLGSVIFIKKAKKNDLRLVVFLGSFSFEIKNNCNSKDIAWMFI